MDDKTIDKTYTEMFALCDKELRVLKAIVEQQKNKEEQERLKRIQVRIGV